MADNTGFKDHRGHDIHSGDRCLIDGGHCDDWYGYIVQKLNGTFWFKYDNDGDEVALEKVATSLEVI